MLRRSVFTNPVTDLSMCIGGTVVACLLLLETPTRGQATGDMPYLVKNIDASGSSEPGEFVQVGRFTYFRAHDGVHGSELWRTDGTEEGTSLVTDINAGEASSFPSDLIGFKAKLFFTARTDEAGREVWSTDGSAEGTGLLGDINPGSSDGVDAFQRLFVPFGDTLYFRGQDLAGIELWKTDGTPEGTVLVGDIHPGAQWSVPIYLAPLRGRVYFSADDKYTPELLAFDRELWTTDGTSRGTFRVKDIHPGPLPSIPGELTRLNEVILFSAGEPRGGQELWRSDGSEDGTVRVRDINPGPQGSFPSNFRAAGHYVYFAADDGASGRELWRSDGTSPGTVRVKDISPAGAFSGPLELTEFGNGLLFTSDDGDHGRELWSTDGTEYGTRLVMDIVPGPGSSTPQSLTVAGDDVYFTISKDFDSHDFTGVTELWKTDGTSAGTHMVWQAPGRFRGPSIRELSAARHHLFLVAPTAVDSQGQSADFEPHAVELHPSGGR